MEGHDFTVVMFWILGHLQGITGSPSAFWVRRVASQMERTPSVVSVALVTSLKLG